MNEQTRQVVEIAGVKLDLDMRTAVRVETLRVGDRVKVLRKAGYGGGSYKAEPGIVVGFEPFKSLPTIIIAIIVSDYSGAKLDFVYLNAKTEDAEIVKAIDDDGIDVQKDVVIANFDRQVATKQAEIEEIERRREFFLREFRAYWQPVATAQEA